MLAEGDPFSSTNPDNRVIVPATSFSQRGYSEVYITESTGTRANETAMGIRDSLNDREQFIVRERKLRDAPRTLESLGDELGLSKERIRQLESAAFGKMRKSLEGRSREVLNFLA